MSNEESCWVFQRCVRDRHGSHPLNGRNSDKERAERASVFNCDLKILPKATTDLETTLLEGKQLSVGWPSQMLSGSRVLACYVLATHQVSVMQIPKNPRKSEAFHFFPVQLTLKAYVP